jgi:hypothetical protein
VDDQSRVEYVILALTHHKMRRILAGITLFATAAVSARADYASTLLAHGPVAYWRFDEATTSPPLYTITNYSSMGAVLNGYGVGTVISGQPGIVGNCARFSNPGNAVGSLFSKIDVPWNAAINPNPPFSIEFWAKPNSLGMDASGSCPLENYDPNFAGSSRAGWYFYVNNAGRWQFRLGNRSGFTAITGTNGDATTGIWQHIVGTWDGATAKLYANGVLIGSGPVAAANWVNNPQSFLRMGGTSLSGTNAVTPIISASSNNGDRGYDGWLDEVAIYNKLLSTSTINAHYQAAATNNAGYHAQILSDNPVAYWELEEPAVAAPAPGTFPIASNMGSFGASADATNMWGALANQPGPGYSGLGGSADRAVFFDGDNGFCQVKDAAGLHFSNTISLVAWVKPAQKDFFRDIIAHGFTPSGAETFLRISRGPGGNGFGDGNYYEVGSSDGTTYYDSALFPIPPGDMGSWVFLAGTFDGTNWNLYRNGQLVQSLTTLSAGDNGAIDVAGPWTIGSRQVDAYFSGQEYSFGGTMDEPAVFTNALSAADILALYYAAQVPPVFTLALQNPGTVAAGSSVNFSVWAEGNPILGFLWSSNGISTGVTATNYTISNIQPGTYTIAVVVTNAYGTNSSSVTLNAINVSPSISAQPISTTRIAGFPFNFSVTAGGTPPLTYYWMLGSNVVQSGAASNYTAVASPANAGSYTVIVSNVTGVTVTSTPAILTVNPVPGGYGGAVVASGPMAFWRLDETNGNIAHDQIAGNDGTYLNATLGQLPSYSLLDPNETAVAFNGLNSYVTISGKAINFTGHTNFTLEAWVKAPAGLANESTIMVKGIGSTGTPHSEQFDVDVYNGVYRFYVASSLYAPISEVDATQGPNGAWQNVVAVYDDQNTLGGGSNMYIFVNGVQQGSGPVPANGLNTTTSPVSIGSKRTGNDPNYSATFNGLVSQVAVYNTALSASAIRSHYAAATTLPPLAIKSLGGGMVKVSWPLGTLQSAPSVVGPYTNMPVTSPFTNAASGTTFYRAKL